MGRANDTQGGLIMRWRAVCVCVGLAALPGLLGWSPAAWAQQKSEISLSRQPGFPYLPSLVIEKQQLIEKHAKRLGLPALKVNWVNFSGGGAQTDALLAGAVDFVTPGPPTCFSCGIGPKAA
jgi:NitT/TauT family transport system substrate-binding protein